MPVKLVVAHGMKLDVAVSMTDKNVANSDLRQLIVDMGGNHMLENEVRSRHDGTDSSCDHQLKLEQWRELLRNDVAGDFTTEPTLTPSEICSAHVHVQVAQ